MSEVKLNINNYSKCLCPVCPVQGNSKCIAFKKGGWKKVRENVGKVLIEYPNHPESYDMEFNGLEEDDIGKRNDFHAPKKDEMIELYCSKAVGRSNCSDLDENKACQCPDCLVWETHKLGSMYYCLGKEK